MCFCFWEKEKKKIFEQLNINKLTKRLFFSFTLPHKFGEIASSYETGQLICGVGTVFGSVKYGNDRTVRGKTGAAARPVVQRCPETDAACVREFDWTVVGVAPVVPPGSPVGHKLCPHTKWRICRKLDERRPATRQWTCQSVLWECRD